VWLPDVNVKFLKGKHIPLFISFSSSPMFCPSVHIHSMLTEEVTHTSSLLGE